MLRTALRQCLVFVALSAMSLSLHAEQIVVTDDGSEVLLKDDGSWVQLSRDRFATSRSGERIRLQPNGRWDKVVDPRQVDGAVESIPVAPVVSESVGQSNPSYASSADYRLLLEKTEILKVEVKTQKSRRIETRTVFYLDLLNRSAETISLESLDNKQFSAVASSREKFEVINVDADKLELASGERAQIQVTTDGSPQWFGVKYLSLTVKADAFGGPEQVLSVNLDDVQRITVDSF